MEPLLSGNTYFESFFSHLGDGSSLLHLLSLNPGFVFPDPERVPIMPRPRNKRGNKDQEPSRKLELIDFLTDIMQSLSGEPRSTADPEVVAAEIMKCQEKRMLQNIREIMAYVYQFSKSCIFLIWIQSIYIPQNYQSISNSTPLSFGLVYSAPSSNMDDT